MIFEVFCKEGAIFTNQSILPEQKYQNISQLVFGATAVYYIKLEPLPPGDPPARPGTPVAGDTKCPASACFMARGTNDAA